MSWMQLVLICMLAISATADEFNPDFTYDDFMRNYNRHYVGAEKDAHEAAFNRNYAELMRAKAQGKDVVVNQRLDWIDEQNNDFFTYNPMASGIRASTRPLTSNFLFASPTSFDWRFYNAVTPIKDQGSCGSCWAFSATAQYQSKISILTNTNYDLSQQYVLKCQTNYSYGCSGGFPYRALQLIQNTGIPLQSTYPYSPSTVYSNICSNSTGRVKLNQTVNAVNFYYYQNLTVEQLQQDLVTYGPINVGVYASDTSFNYAGSSGLISCAPAYSINHAILLVGYNQTHWFIKNSWGTSWGNNGYGYISKNTSNDCNIRQYVNEMQINLTPPPPPDPNLVNVTITLTDSFGDGWNGNILSIRQESNLVGSFGGGFTSGSSSGPINIAILGNKEAQIVVTQFGTKSDEIGFTVAATNGTILYQRNSGTAFDASTVFSTFCVQGGCPSVLLLTITMTDTYGDGWSGTVLALQQNNAIIATFGSNFTSGTSSGPLYVSVQGNLETQVVVSQLGAWTQQIGFTIKAPNGTTIHQRNSGQIFLVPTIFTSFCPVSSCGNSMYSTLTITMSDSAGDGWNGNILALKQNNTVVAVFGDSFISGNSDGPIFVTVLGNVGVTVAVSQLGTKKGEIGYVIKAANGTLLHQRASGIRFNASAVLGTFCPVDGCLDLTIFNLTITMTDSYSDGWSGNVIAIKQNNSVVGTFGSSFINGGSSGPVYIAIQGRTQAQIVVSSLGSWSSQVGFIIKAPNGTIIYQRNSGSAFNQYTVFKIFCLSGGCESTSYFTLTITMTDSYGDGWNSNVLAIKQNNTIIGTFGHAFLSGFTTDPTSIVILKNLTTQIVVHQLGTKTNEIGFTIKAPNDTTIYQRVNGTTFDASKIFNIFCPVDGCLNILTLNITMSDSFGDGWNGNVLGVKQNQSVIGVFGDTFTSGSVGNSVSVNVLGNLNVQVIVTQFGIKTDEVGFIIKAPNGTIVHQRNAGSAFNSSSIFSTFCPIGGCPDPTLLNLTITMTDSYGDGWSGNVIGIKQNNTIVGTFGNSFTTGSSSGPVYIAVQGNREAQIVVTTLGNFGGQIGFIVKAPNGTIIHQRFSGYSFTSTTIFKTFCPIGGCPIDPNVTYFLTTSDSFGDGWQGTVLAFKINTTVLYTFTLTGGYTNTSIPYSFPKMQTVSVSVYIRGNYTNQVGLSIVTSQGYYVFQRSSGNKFYANTLLGTFCVECLNLSPVSILPQPQAQAQIKTQLTPPPISQPSTPISPLSPTVAPSSPFLIPTIALSSISSLMLVAVIALVYKLALTKNKIQNFKHIVCQTLKTEEKLENQVKSQSVEDYCVENVEKRD